jgi:type II secretory pathway component PulM
MKLVLSPRLQRILAIGILLLILVLAFNLLAWPLWTSWSEHAERIDMLKRQAAVMEALAAAAPRYEAAAKKLAANPDAKLLTYAAPQATLAVAQLQSQLSQLITSASAVVASSQVLPEARVRSLTKISVQTMVEGEVKAVMKALHGIEGARPLLKIDKLVIRDPDGEWAVAPQANAPNKLQVEIVVSAYMRAP